MRAIRQTAEAIIRQVWTVAVCKMANRNPAGVSPSELELLLLPYAPHMEAQVRMIVEVAQRARLEGIEDVQAKLHEADALDHEMVDQAIEYATIRREEET